MKRQMDEMTALAPEPVEVSGLNRCARHGAVNQGGCRADESAPLVRYKVVNLAMALN